LSIRQLCGLLDVSRSWVYARPHAPRQAQRDVALRDATGQIVLELPDYGYRRVTAELHRQQWADNHKRVLRIMRQGVAVPTQAQLARHDRLAPRALRYVCDCCMLNVAPVAQHYKRLVSQIL